MTHHVFRVDAADKGQIVQELASGLGRTVMFTRTKHQAKKLAKQLTAAGVPAVDLHGNLSQNARERNLEAFSNGTTRVLCATDIAARGIHVDDVAIVVHVDPPAEHKAYLHRSGRTARAGAGGIVVTIATADQAGEVRTLARQAGITPEVSAIKPGAREITALTGPAAPYVQPAPVEAPQPQGTGGGGNGGRRRRSSGASSSATAGSSSAGRGSGRPAGPARTRAELAARAGQAPSGAGRGRGRSGR
jgi:superfamily II DNA/RNA helicase